MLPSSHRRPKDFEARRGRVGADGPVLIDLPQLVGAAGNHALRAMLLREVHDIRDGLARVASERATTRLAGAMWVPNEKGELRPDAVLPGAFEDVSDDGDAEIVLDSIAEARCEAQVRQQGATGPRSGPAHAIRSLRR